MKDITLRIDNFGSNSMIGRFMQYLLERKIMVVKENSEGYNVTFVIGKIPYGILLDSEMISFEKCTGSICSVKRTLDTEGPGITIEVGDEVTYVTQHTPPEHGRVKYISKDGNLFVVYNCNGDWKNYTNYTAASTRREDLVRGWI